jgi:hypothetical protein
MLRALEKRRHLNFHFSSSSELQTNEQWLEWQVNVPTTLQGRQSSPRSCLRRSCSLSGLSKDWTDGMSLSRAITGIGSIARSDWRYPRWTDRGGLCDGDESETREKLPRPTG